MHMMSSNRLRNGCKVIFKKIIWFTGLRKIVHLDPAWIINARDMYRPVQ